MNESSALVIAHPGHELRVHGWLERTRPRVFVLTDGSGAAGPSRIASTGKVLQRTGALPGSVFARTTDAALYARLRSGAAEWFVALARELAEAWVGEGTRRVVVDALEGYNPGHDVCRYVVNAAVAFAERRFGLSLGLFDFPLVGPPDAGAVGSDLRIELTDEELHRKIAAATGYAELEAEVHELMRAEGTPAFRLEVLRRLSSRRADLPPPDDPPLYERFGEDRVRDGRYTEVIRYRSHLRPIAERLQHLGESE